MFIAERAGFEPAIRFWRTHAFQACLFSHSSISPGVSIVFLFFPKYRKNAYKSNEFLYSLAYRLSGLSIIWGLLYIFKSRGWPYGIFFGLSGR